MKFIIIFSIIFFALLSNFNQIVFAQSVAPSPIPTPVDYQLPYPGLLPDNPLYKLKTLRDKIVFFLISDPLKKAQFDLLQSDKRLNSAWYLLQGKTADSQLIIDTLSKGQNYFVEGISELSLAKKQGLSTTDMLRQFLLSSQKHKEVTSQMKLLMPDSISQLETELKRIDASINQINLQAAK